MSVLVDTSVWSLALRRAPRSLSPGDKRVVAAWVALVRDGGALLIGPIRQELLSGIRHEADFERLKDRLAAFDDVPIATTDYEQGAKFYNACRTRGLAGTAIDLLICAVASRNGVPIFTTDRDFARYRGVLPIRLFEPTG
ncbi:MAG: PIN domain-containing protein [Deltaproteobacteria bacterium]|nr:PIN domain-containing protein [Deltaproteobacteria bacterium]